MRTPIQEARKMYNALEEWTHLASGNGRKDAHPVAVGQDMVKALGYAVDENGLDLAGRDPQLVFEKLLHGCPLCQFTD